MSIFHNIIRIFLCFALSTAVLSHNAENETQTRQFVKLNMKQGLVMNQILSFYGIEKTNDTQCKSDVVEFKNGLRAFEPWALQMFDASSKLQGGILAGNLMEFGSYAQCVNVKHLNFAGKHCILKIAPSQALVKTIVMFRNLTEGAWSNVRIIVEGAAIFWSVCVPDSCAHYDVLYHFNKSIVDITVGLGLEVSLEENFCVTLEDYPKMGSTQYVTLCFLGGFVLVCAIATIMELQQRQSENVIVDSFSFIRNFKRITSEGTASDFDCVHGLRTLSSCYVVVGHRFLFSVFFPLVNTLDILDWTLKASSILIISGGVTVDTFFFLSGFLVSFSFFRHVATTGRFNLLVFYLRRYIRITCPFAIAVLFYATLLQFLGNGPLFLQSVKALQLPCQYFWWSALLHIQRYLNPGFACIIQTWSLNCEMLYYFCSPLVLIPLWKSPKVGYVVFAFFYFVSVAASFYVAWVNEYEAVFPITNTFLSSDYFNFHYAAPHCRAAPYIIGIGFGYILCKLDGRKVKTSFLFNFSAWIICSCLMVISVFGVRVFMTDSYEYNKLDASMFLSLSRTGWTLGLAWIIWTCVNGQGGVLNYFFSMYGFKVLGRISYGIHLFHVGFQYVKHSNDKNPAYFSNFESIYQGFGDLMIMFFFGFFFTIFFELPLVKLESLAFKPTSKKVNPEK